HATVCTHTDVPNRPSAVIFEIYAESAVAVDGITQDRIPGHITTPHDHAFTLVVVNRVSADGHVIRIGGVAPASQTDTNAARTIAEVSRVHGAGPGLVGNVSVSAAG